MSKAIEAKKIEIKSIKLKLGKIEANLTIEEARKLKEALEGIFGKEVIREHYPVSLPYPIIIEDRRPYWYHDNTFWCGDKLTTTNDAPPLMTMDTGSNMLVCSLDVDQTKCV